MKIINSDIKVITRLNIVLMARYVRTALLTIPLLFCSFSVRATIISQETFIDDMVIRHGFDKFDLTQLLDKAKVEKSILKA
ncbi:MAG: hypothetical protein DRR19_08535, partial [Candidatus Parabeggiatoa sp. nov. 1]